MLGFFPHTSVRDRGEEPFFFHSKVILLRSTSVLVRGNEIISFHSMGILFPHISFLHRGRKVSSFFYIVAVLGLFQSYGERRKKTRFL